MYMLVNILGIAVFLLVGVLFSKKRREIRWRSVGILFVVDLVLAWFLTNAEVGRTCVAWAMGGFSWLMSAAYQGIAVVFPDWVNAPRMDFFTMVLLPILFIVPFFDMLTYIGFWTFVIRVVGRGLAYVTRLPRFESFYAVMMMFMGGAAALGISRLQLSRMKADRLLFVSMLSMSSLSAGALGAYLVTMPAEFVLAGVPVQMVGALIVTEILHPVKISEAEDTVVSLAQEKRGHAPFFTYLMNSILTAGKLVLIVGATIIAFVALVKFIDMLLVLIHPNFTLENLLGCVMFPFAWLTGMGADDAFTVGAYMGEKLLSGEFAVMTSVRDTLYLFPRHVQAVLTVFITSFANFATIGVILGTVKGLADASKNDLLAHNVGYLALAGILTSLLSAGLVGLFVW